MPLKMRLPVLKAPRLRRGDTVGIVSPSWGGAGVFPHRVERGVAQLEALGYRVKLGRHALNEHGFVSDTAEHRVSDLHELFLDPSVRLILAAIGGDHSCHLLPLLDFDLIRRHPKALVGFSDIFATIDVADRLSRAHRYRAANVRDFGAGGHLGPANG